MKITVSKCISTVFIWAIIWALFVSGAALNFLGLNYSGDDSSSGLKVHPYAVLVCVALLLSVCTRRRFNRMISDKKFIYPMSCSAILVAVLVFKSTGSSHQSLGFAVDTLLVALLAAAVLPYLSLNAAMGIRRLGIAFVIIECLLAVFEVVTKIEIIPIDTWYGSYFRATALHGHPLNNALILVTVAIAIQVCSRKIVSAALFLVVVAALCAFGARGALAIFVSFNTLFFVRYGMRSSKKMATVMFVTPVAIASVGWILLSGAIGDRIANVGAYDDSSGVRLQSMQMLNQLNWGNLLVGIDSDKVLKIMDAQGVGVIENFLVAYIFMFGLACTILLIICFFVSAKYLSARCEKVAQHAFCLTFLAFFLTALTNNSLVTKTPALFLCFVFGWAALRIKDANAQMVSGLS